jgi:hypothetical protein
MAVRATEIGERGRNLSDEVADITRGLLRAYAEGLAVEADALRRFWTEVLEDESLQESETEAEFIRHSPRALRRASRSFTRDVLAMPERVIDTFYHEYHRAKRSRHARTHMKSESSASSMPERQIVGEARAYLNRIPAAGATELGLVEHVTLATGYDEDIVRSILRRHFVFASGLVKREPKPSTDVPENDVKDRMRNTLREHGYSDIRSQVPLAAFPDVNETASVVAFENNLPVVLCYPVDSGVDDISVREAARVQAMGINTEHPARVVWISDGNEDYYYDVAKNVAIPRLPSDFRQD